MGKPEEVAKQFLWAEVSTLHAATTQWFDDDNHGTAESWERLSSGIAKRLAAILRENGMGAVPLCEKCGKYPPIERSALCLHCHPRYSDPGESSPSPSGAKTCRDTRLEMAFRWADENLGGLTMKEIVPILWRNRNTMAIRELVDAAREAKSR